MSTGTPNPYHPRRQHEGRAAPRGRRRALLPLGVAGWALLEIWLLTLLGQAAGGLTVFLVLLAGLVIGALLIKRAGRRAWQRLSASMQQGTAPPDTRGSRGGGNAMAMLGGLLIMIPGLASDAIGLLCVFPPTAALLRRGAVRVLGRPTAVGLAFEEARAAHEHMRIHRPDGKVVRGEVVDEDDRRGDHRDGGRPS